MENNNIKRIEDYQAGRLSKDEEIAFEEQLKVDPTLAKDLELWQDLTKVVKSSVEKDVMNNYHKLNEQLKNDGFWKKIEKEHQVETPKEIKPKIVQFPTRRVLAIAASVALIISTIFFLFSDSKEEQLFANHFRPYKDVVGTYIDSPGFTGTPEAATLEEATEAYQHKKYKAAILGFDNFLSQAETLRATTYLQQIVRFEKAVSLLAINHSAEALVLFQQLSKETGHGLDDAIKWHTAMTYIRMNDTDNAKQYFKSLVDSREFGDKAKGILADLEKK